MPTSLYIEELITTATTNQLLFSTATRSICSFSSFVLSTGGFVEPVVDGAVKSIHQISFTSRRSTKLQLRSDIEQSMCSETHRSSWIHSPCLNVRPLVSRRNPLLTEVA
jgi:hypothetical protein